MEALSDSKTTNKLSKWMSSPTATPTSMTSTSSMSPRSGTKISILRDTPESALDIDSGVAAAAGTTDSAVAAVSVVSVVSLVSLVSVASIGGEEASVAITAINAPSATRSPTCTAKDSNTPSHSAGTSMDALSDSITMSVSPSATALPGSTHSSITSTSSMSPRLGIKMFMLYCCSLTTFCLGKWFLLKPT